METFPLSKPTCLDRHTWQAAMLKMTACWFNALLFSLTCFEDCCERQALLADAKKPVAKTTIRNRDGSLCASVPLWFNLPFALMHTDEPRGEARLSCGLECIPAILQAVLAGA